MAAVAGELDRRGATSGAVQHSRGQWLVRVPVSYFGMVLGLEGLAGSWREAHAAWGGPSVIGEGLFALAAVVWLALTGLYLAKWIWRFGEALSECADPLRGSFIGLGGVATLLLAQGALPYSREVAVVLFFAGGTFSLGFGIWRSGPLWQGQRPVEVTTPLLYLPIVASGFVIAATAGALGWHAWAALAFGGAFFSWLALESVVLHRLLEAATLPPEVRPVLGILLAPPAVGALAALAGGANPAGPLVLGLAGYGLLQAMLLLRMWWWIAKQPFAPSYWAITFGATALPNTVTRLAMASPGHELAGLGFALFVASNLLVGVIGFKTIMLFLRPRHSPEPAA
ncbi:dicarboxylate transporter/tellurite-resistance protein TehA [Novosphingobium sp.]|uniref:SLAC1 family transporter n=1 Tax=Novosphingobium sp. TaxID=1874826 RepID=UPI003BABE075